MSQIVNKLEKLLTKHLGATGLSKQSMLPVLQRLGGIQEMVDSYSKGSMDPQTIQRLQSQMAAISLDDSAVSELKKAIRQLKTLDGSISISEKEISTLVKDLRRVQTQMAQPGMDSVGMSEAMSSLQQIFTRAEAMILDQMNGTNMSSSKLLKALKKLQ